MPITFSPLSAFNAMVEQHKLHEEAYATWSNLGPINPQHPNEHILGSIYQEMEARIQKKSPQEQARVLLNGAQSNPYEALVVLFYAPVFYDAIIQQAKTNTLQYPRRYPLGWERYYRPHEVIALILESIRESNLNRETGRQIPKWCAWWLIKEPTWIKRFLSVEWQDGIHLPPEFDLLEAILRENDNALDEVLNSNVYQEKGPDIFWGPFGCRYIQSRLRIFQDTLEKPGEDSEKAAELRGLFKKILSHSKIASAIGALNARGMMELNYTAGVHTPSYYRGYIHPVSQLMLLDDKMTRWLLEESPLGEIPLSDQLKEALNEQHQAHPEIGKILESLAKEETNLSLEPCRLTR